MAVNANLLTHSSVSSSEHFIYSQREYGPLHAKSLQQQNLVSSLTCGTGIQLVSNR